jgi:acetylornithine deacetylase/succinyl-diaminopimelate desuccinylase-like protein
MQPVTSNFVEAYLNKIWRAQLSIVGADGLPQAAIAGNVLRPETKLKLSLRLPPTKDPKEAESALTKLVRHFNPKPIVDRKRALQCQSRNQFDACRSGIPRSSFIEISEISTQRSVQAILHQRNG